MNRKTNFVAIGGYQPFLFCIGMYFVALFFSIFICSAIFYAVNPRTTLAKQDSKYSDKTALTFASKQVLLTVAK